MKRRFYQAFVAPTYSESPAFDAYVDPARHQSEIWRLLAGTAIIVALWLAGALLVVIGAVIVLPGELNTLLDSIGGMSSPTGVLIALASFAGIWGGVALAARVLHGRGLRTVLAAPGRPLLRGFGRGMLVAVALVALPLVVTLPFSEAPVRSSVALADWAVWFAILVPLIFLQAGAEELIFRGYLQQQLAARFASPWVWALVPSILFGLMHFSNPTLGLTERLLYVASTGFFGLAAAAMVYQTGGLGAALGFHVTVNAAGITLFGLEDVYDGVSLFVVPEGNVRTGLIIDTAVMAAFASLVVSPLSPFRRRAARATATDWSRPPPTIGDSRID